MTSLAHRANQFLRKVTGLEVRRVAANAGRADAKGSVASPNGPPQAPLPKSTIPVGGARACNFFDDYPRFFTTSKTTPHPIRLNLRYEAILAQNREVFDGATVLDIASHDGRWSFAALKTGATSVVGIEGRPELVANAEESLAVYDIDPSRYRFLTGDIFEVLRDEDIKVDVVMCLGFLYHTLRYNELMSLIARCDPKHLIIDTEIASVDAPFVRLHTERAARERNAIADQYTLGSSVLTGKPSLKAVESIVNAYGFKVDRRSDWAALLRDNPTDNTIGSYRRGRRATFCCSTVK